MTKELRDGADDHEGKAVALLRLVDAGRWKIATAESCTGGLLASLLTDIEGLSSNFERGFVTYSDAAKCAMLGVEEGLIKRRGAVSREVATAMAEGALAHSEAHIACAITGFAGHGGPDDPPGLVYIATAANGGISTVEEYRFGDVGREAVRHHALGAALTQLERTIAAIGPGADARSAA